MDDENERSRPTSRRANHFSQQRSSGPSTIASHSRTRSLSQLSESYQSRDDHSNVDGPALVGRRKGRSWYKHNSLDTEGPSEESDKQLGPRGRQRATREYLQSRQASKAGTAGEDTLGELNAASPVIRSRQEKSIYDEKSNRSQTHGMHRPAWMEDLGHRPTPPASVGSEDDAVTALPTPIRRNKEHSSRVQLHGSQSWQGTSRESHMIPPAEVTSGPLTELYTVSYLIFFAIFGTLARLGLQWLTFYPGAPVVLGVLWANFTGSVTMGFLAEDKRLFQQEWGTSTVDRLSTRWKDVEAGKRKAVVKAEHAKVKKTIPMYIGLATGFCGSFTSFSSFIRDVFFALSNDLPSPEDHYAYSIAPISSHPSRNGGYSVMAVLAVVILTVTVCLAAYQIGGHIALLLDPITPTLSHNAVRKFVDPTFVFLGWGCWLAAVFMTIWPPDRPGGPVGRASWDAETWRGQVLFALIFAPLGCLLRYYSSLKLNGISPAFPLGTFAVNMFGTAVLGMAYDLQHVRLAGSLVGGGRVSCQALQGIMDGFDGCLTTVSTWVAELHSLRRRHAYIYGALSILVGLGLLVIIMGSVRWSIGWETPACVS